VGVNKIAVLRANSIGDFITCLPALQALRSAYPEAQIVYLGCEWHRDFLKNRPSPIDRVIVLPVSEGVRVDDDGSEPDPQAVERFLNEMHAEHFDLALQVHGGGTFTNPFINHMGARFTAGFRTAETDALDIALPYATFQNDIMRTLELVEKVGASMVTVEPHLNVIAGDLAEAQEVFGDLRRPAYVVLHVGAHDPRRRWPPESFALAGDHFAALGYRIAVLGGPQEVGVAQTVVEAMTKPAQNVAGRLSLGGATGLLSEAALVIANDSGPLHMAEALGRQTVGLYWVGNLLDFGSLYRERHVPLVSWTTSCPVCHMRYTSGNLGEAAAERCSHVVSFIDDIPVDAVIEAGEGLLDF
jgi:ADP-heptose:LPS heptosyltransferase